MQAKLAPRNSSIAWRSRIVKNERLVGCAVDIPLNEIPNCANIYLHLGERK
jgi:hypothetical protein